MATTKESLAKLVTTNKNEIVGSRLGQAVDTILEDPAVPYTVLGMSAIDPSVMVYKTPIFTSTEINRLNSKSLNKGKTIQGGFDSVLTLPIATAAFGFSIQNDRKELDEELHCYISWGLKRFELQYDSDIKFKKDALTALTGQGAATFVRQYGDSYISKVVLGARWDAKITFKFKSVDKKTGFKAKLNASQTAQNIVSIMSSMEGNHWYSNADIEIMVEKSQIGGLQLSLSKQIENQEQRLRDLQTNKNIAERNSKDKDAEFTRAQQDLATLQKAKPTLEKELETAKTTMEANELAAKDAKTLAEKLKAGLDNLAGDALTEATKKYKEAEAASIKAESKSAESKNDFEKKKKQNEQMLTDLDSANKSVQKLKDESIKLKAKFDQIGLETEQQTNRLDGLQKLSADEVIKNSSTSEPTKLMDKDAFIAFYNKTKAEIEKIQRNPDAYSFDPIEYDISRYHHIISERSDSDSALSIMKAANRAADIMALLDRCHENIDTKLISLRNASAPGTRSAEMDQIIKKLTNDQSKITTYKAKLKESACLERKQHLKELAEIKDLVSYLNKLDEDPIFKKATSEGVLSRTLTVKQIHIDAIKKKEKVPGSIHHWREASFSIPRITSETTQLRIVASKDYQGNFALGYKEGAGTFENLPMITEAGIPVEYIDKPGTYFYTIQKELRDKFRNEKFTFASLQGHEKNHDHNPFTIKIYLMDERPSLSSKCVDEYLELETNYFQISSPKAGSGGSGGSAGAPAVNPMLFSNGTSSTGGSAGAPAIKSPIFFSNGQKETLKDASKPEDQKKTEEEKPKINESKPADQKKAEEEKPKIAAAAP